MSDKPRSRRPGRRAAVWLAVAVLVLVLYVVSYGPGMWLIERNPAMRWARSFYWPIGWLYRLPLLGHLLDWWLRWWS
jgi:hypothetical protein